MKEVTYACADPDCNEPHTAVVMESLPNTPLSYDEIESLPEKHPITAVKGHDSFRSYTGTDDEYRETHTDLIALIYNDTGRLIRFIPDVGWAVESEIDLAPQDNPDAVLQTLFDDWEAGVV